MQVHAYIYIYICLHAFELNCGFDRDYNLGSKIRPERDCQTRRTKRPQTWYLFVTFWTSWEVARRQFRKISSETATHAIYLCALGAPEGSQKRTKREPKENQREPKRSQREPTGSQKVAKRSQREPKEAKGSQKGAKGSQQGSKGSQQAAKREPKGAKGNQQGAKREPKGSQ